MRVFGLTGEQTGVACEPIAFTDHMKHQVSTLNLLKPMLQHLQGYLGMNRADQGTPVRLGYSGKSSLTGRKRKSSTYKTLDPTKNINDGTST